MCWYMWRSLACPSTSRTLFSGLQVVSTHGKQVASLLARFLLTAQGMGASGLFVCPGPARGEEIICQRGFSLESLDTILERRQNFSNKTLQQICVVSATRIGGYLKRKELKEYFERFPNCFLYYLKSHYPKHRAQVQYWAHNGNMADEHNVKYM